MRLLMVIVALVVAFVAYVVFKLIGVVFQIALVGAAMGFVAALVIAFMLHRWRRKAVSKDYQPAIRRE